MANNALPQFLLGAGVVAALAAGFWIVGGPETGRMESRDKTRAADLQSLQQHVICLANDNGQTLPETMDENPACPAPHLTDRFTDRPYRYNRLSDRIFEVCAEFELPDRLYPHPHFDPETGCRRMTYKATRDTERFKPMQQFEVVPQ